ncbi:MAG: 2-oxoacid:ferredoxin oxidoreductase subunit alpha [Thermocladium sp.]
MVKITWMIGGPQGSGVDTSATVFGNALARAGYYIYGNREYHSNIEGRHSYFNLTISDKPMHSISDDVNILVTFEAESIFQHFREVRDYLVYNKAVESTKLAAINSIERETAEDIEKFLESIKVPPTVEGVLDYLRGKGVKLVPVEYDKILASVADEMKLSVATISRSRNIIAAAVSLKLLGLDKEYLAEAIRGLFKNELFVKANLLAADKAYGLVNAVYGLKGIPINGHRVQLDGNTAVALGKIAGGLRFQSYYPITPASDESVFIEANQVVEVIDPDTKESRKVGIVVVQTEDELAAINASIGAALTGARAATSTSGPGFSLMVEGLGWAGMNEVPVVVTYYMRGAPSTGLPTRSGQADLLFSIHAGHGEFPKIVLASGDHVEAFKDAIWAFNLAERYQTPVIHLVDKSLANAYSIIDETELDYSSIKADRGKVIVPSGEYKRFQFVDDHISPRAFIGNAVMHYTGDEHNEEGHISENVNNRTKMYEKRMKKLEVADKEIPEELRLNVFGEGDIAVVTWGSPKGAVLDAMEELKQEGVSIQLIQLRMFSPFPRNLVTKLLKGKSRIIDVENNYTAQAASVMALSTGIEPTNYVLKWNGRPITRTEVKTAIKQVIEKNEKRVVLNGGQ